MQSTFVSLLGTVIAMALTGAACAQPVAAPPSPAPLPASAASKPTPTRSPAVRAAENANEPGTLRPEQRVIPQISFPLKRINGAAPAPPAASLPAGAVPGAVNDGAARCLATRGDEGGAVCQRGLPASASAAAKKQR